MGNGKDRSKGYKKDQTTVRLVSSLETADMIAVSAETETESDMMRRCIRNSNGTNISDETTHLLAVTPEMIASYMADHERKHTPM